MEPVSGGVPAIIEKYYNRNMFFRDRRFEFMIMFDRVIRVQNSKHGSPIFNILLNRVRP